MGFFKTKDPKTGEPKLGAGVYLIICGLMIGGVVLWNITKDSNSGIPQDETKVNAQIKENKSSIALIAEAARSHKEEIPELAESSIAQGAQSDRGADFSAEDKKAEAVEKEIKTVDSVDDTFEILRQSQERTAREKAAAVAKAREEARAAAAAEIERLRLLAEQNGQEVTTPQAKTSRRARRSRRSQATKKDTVANVAADEEDPEIVVDKEALMVYDAKRDNKKVEPQPVVVQQPTGFDTGDFLPRGHVFPVYILSTVQSVGQEDIVIMAVAENVIFQHKVQIPFGTRLFGQGAATSFEDRIAINVDTILYPDGRELPISAFLKDPLDMSAGVRGYYIPQPLRVQLVPYINEFMASWLDSVADREDYNTGSRTNFNAKSDSLEGTSNLVREQAARIQKRLDARYPEKVIIPIGTKAYVQLRSALDLTRAAVAGSFNNTQPILPGFENNPIRPSGFIEQAANGYTGAQKNNAPLSNQANAIDWASLFQAQAPAAAQQQQPQLNPNVEASQKELQTYLDALDEMSESLNLK